MKNIKRNQNSICKLIIISVVASFLMVGTFQVYTPQNNQITSNTIKPTPSLILTVGKLRDWCDNFDSYPEGPLNGQGGWDAGGDHVWVTSEKAHSSPHSCRFDQNGNAIHPYVGYTSGIWIYTTWQYIPVEASGHSTYFILKNRLGQEESWATQLEFNPDLHIVESEFEGAALPLEQGEWVELRIVIDLDHDVQHIFYDDQLLSSKSWTDGVSGDGDLNIAGVDIWANFAEYKVYYDDMSLTPGIHGDVNGDGDVDTGDLLTLIAAWGNTDGGPEDINGDGVVNTADLLILLANWTG